jgi:hypothetical protein
MTFKSGGIRAGIEKLKVNSGRQTSERDRIAKAVKSCGLEPDLAVRATNEIFGCKNRYEKAVELMGVMRADKIRDAL